jgi:hypothetical protein
MDMQILMAELKAANLTASMTAEQAAKATHAAVAKACAQLGMKPEVETFIRAPGEARHFGDETCWVVAWESGPYEWAIEASLSSAFPALAEPYYSFDLTFYEAEWAQ